MQKHPKFSLIERFKDLPDPRVNRTKDHEWVDVLTVAICTLLCAGESFNDLEDFGKAKVGVESSETGGNQEARHSRQATQCQLGSRLFAPLARRPNLDASALRLGGRA